MEINWQIKKNRGNFRPRLTYTITLESFEKKLAIHAVQVESVNAHPPLEQTGSLNISDDTRSRIASRVTADRMLSLFG